MSESANYSGSCFCGAVKLKLSGTPAAMGYCHCDDCRHWSAGPVNAFTLWNPDNLTIVSGEEHIVTYNKTAGSSRKWCGKCGGHLMTDHPEMKLVDVYAAILPELPFEPALHVFYAEKVLGVKDGLPKMKDMPAEMGGSGETLPE